MKYVFTGKTLEGKEVTASVQNEGEIRPILTEDGQWHGDFQLSGRRLRVRNGNLGQPNQPFLRFESYDIAQVTEANSGGVGEQNILFVEEESVLIADNAERLYTLRRPQKLKPAKYTTLLKYLMQGGPEEEVIPPEAFSFMRGVKSLGNNPDVNDPANTGSSRVDPECPLMVRSMLILQMMKGELPSEEQMAELDRWIEDQADRGYHAYYTTDEGECIPWRHDLDEKQRQHGGYRSPTGFSPRFDGRPDATEGGQIDDYMHMASVKLACIANLTNDPVAADYLCDNIEGVASGISKGWTAPRGFGYLPQAIALAKMALHPYRDVSHMEAYADELLTVLEGHNGEFNGQRFNALDDGSRNDHLGVSEWMEAMAEKHGLNAKDLAKSQPIWITGIMCYGFDAFIEAYPESPVSHRMVKQLEIAAEVFLGALKKGFEWETGEYRYPIGHDQVAYPGRTGIAGDISPQGGMFQDEEKSSAVGTYKRFLVPGLLSTAKHVPGFPGVKMAMRIVDVCNYRGYWGGKGPHAANIDAWWRLCGIKGEWLAEK